MTTKDFMCECGKGFATKYSKTRHKQTACRLHAKKDEHQRQQVNGTDETDESSEQISSDIPHTATTIKIPAVQLQEVQLNPTTIGVRLKQRTFSKIRRNRTIASSIFLRHQRPVKYSRAACQFEEKDIEHDSDSNTSYKHKKYSAQSSKKSDCENHSIVALKPNPLLERLTRLQSSEQRSKNTKVSIYTQLSDASTQTDPQQVEFQLVIHGGNRFVFKASP